MHFLVPVILIVLGAIIISIVTGRLFGVDPAPLLYMCYPPLAFYRALSLLGLTAFTGGAAYTFASLQGGDEVYTAVLSLAISTVVLLVLTTYLSFVLPSEFGTTRPWHFPITDLIKACKSKKKEGDKGSNAHVTLKIDEDELHVSQESF